MAVAEMRKLNLAAMSYDRDRVLNALQRTCATEIKHHYEAENTAPVECDGEELRSYLAGVERALGYICAEVENYNKDNKIKSDVLKDGFAVSYSDFMFAKDLKGQADFSVERISALDGERKALAGEKSKLLRTLQTAEIYSALKTPFAEFCDTQHAKIRLGTIPNAEKQSILATVEGDLCAAEELAANEEITLIAFAFHKSFDGDARLSNAGFVSCPFKDGDGEQTYKCLKLREVGIGERLARISEEIISLAEYIKPLKIYCDYLGFELEKAEASKKMRKTAATFFLEAYVPAEREQAVKEELDGVSGAVYYEFGEPAEDEMPPTLYKNNRIVENFETITDMYSPVNAREFDPNGIMAFFYSLFLGFIMGDVGYGLLMLLGGGIIYYLKRKEDGGLKRMSAVFAIGGIFAILWGLAFGSLFGIEIIPPIMPNAKDDTWSLMGINVPAVLIIAMELGIFHLTAGYVCKAIQFMRRGCFWDGMLEGYVWAVFSIGVALAVVGFVEDADMPLLVYIGGGIAGASLLIAMLTAGRKEKLFGKFTKGFGAAYGIIGYVSDVLSYARLYGLMLSGAVIAQIVAEYTLTGNDLTTGFIVSGNPLLVILGVLIFVVGHVFNLAIGLLGAYIHDARLQYVEFYGRFYEGEGELFAPLGSAHKYIKLQSPAKN